MGPYPDDSDREYEVSPNYASPTIKSINYTKKYKSNYTKSRSIHVSARYLGRRNRRLMAPLRWVCNMYWCLHALCMRICMCMCGCTCVRTCACVHVGLRHTTSRGRFRSGWHLIPQMMTSSSDILLLPAITKIPHQGVKTKTIGLRPHSTHAHTHTRTLAHARACARARTYARTHAHTHTRTHTSTHTRTRACAHTHAYTHSHTRGYGSHISALPCVA